MMRTEKLTMLALGLCGLTSLAGCGQGDNGNAPSPASEESVGEVNLGLTLANGQVINSASYTITGPNGFSRTGTIDLTSATQVDRPDRRDPGRDGLLDHHFRHDHQRVHHLWWLGHVQRGGGPDRVRRRPADLSARRHARAASWSTACSTSARRSTGSRRVRPRSLSGARIAPLGAGPRQRRRPERACPTPGRSSAGATLSSASGQEHHSHLQHARAP